MSTRSRLAVLGLVVATCAASATACSSCKDGNGNGDGVADGGPRPVSSALTPEQQGLVLAKVGDKTITLGDYVAALEHMDQFDRLRYQSPERRKELLEEMINVMLLAQEAIDKGYDKDPLAQQEIRAILRDAMLAAARKGAPAPNEIPDEEVKAYFDAHKADYRDPERRRVSMIVLRDEATAKDALASAQKATTATQWGEIVRAKSIDAQAKANVPVDLAGDFGMVSPPGDPRGDNPKIPEAVRVGIFEIAKNGDVLGRYVKAGDKFYVVRLTQKTDAHERTLQEAERTIRVKLAQDKLRGREDALLAELRTQFPVQIDETALATVHVDVADAGVAPDAGHD
jgi:parvulin-like peptidyl-prolyl isomerase